MAGTTKKRGRGDGTIVKRSDGRYAAAISLEGGKRKWYYGKTETEVRTKLREGQVLQQQGRLVLTPNVSTEDYLREWLNNVVRVTLRPQSFNTYRVDVERALPAIGKVRLGSLKPTHIQACYRSLTDRGLASGTIHCTHRTLHTAFDHAIDTGLLAINPTVGVKLPRLEHAEMHILDATQVAELATGTVEDDYHALWLLLVTTGLRIGEALALTWDDWDRETGAVHVRRTMQRVPGKGVEFGPPKTRGSRRTVYVPPSTARALRRHWVQQQKSKLALGSEWHGHNLIFCTTFGKPQWPCTIEEIWRATLARLGLPRIRVHDLRHTYASLHLNAGENPSYVQKNLGHSTIKMTLDRYSHLLPTSHDRAVDRMEQMLRAAEG